MSSAGVATRPESGSGGWPRRPRSLPARGRKAGGEFTDAATGRQRHGAPWVLRPAQGKVRAGAVRSRRDGHGASRSAALSESCSWSASPGGWPAAAPSDHEHDRTGRQEQRRGSERQRLCRCRLPPDHRSAAPRARSNRRCRPPRRRWSASARTSRRHPAPRPAGAGSAAPPSKSLHHVPHTFRQPSASCSSRFRRECFPPLQWSPTCTTYKFRQPVRSRALVIRPQPTPRPAREMPGGALAANHGQIYNASTTSSPLQAWRPPPRRRAAGSMAIPADHRSSALLSSSVQASGQHVDQVGERLVEVRRIGRSKAESETSVAQCVVVRR